MTADRQGSHGDDTAHADAASEGIMAGSGGDDMQREPRRVDDAFSDMASRRQAEQPARLLSEVAGDTTPRVDVTATSPDQPETPAPTSAIIFNRDEAERRCFGSQDMLREMIRFFLDEVDNLFVQMRASLEKGDVREVGRLGHQMKGTLIYLGAEPASNAVFRLERCCKLSQHAPVEVTEAVDVLERQCVILKSVLSRYPLAVDPA